MKKYLVALSFVLLCFGHVFAQFQKGTGIVGISLNNGYEESVDADPPSRVVSFSNSSSRVDQVYGLTLKYGTFIRDRFMIAAGAGYRFNSYSRTEKQITAGSYNSTRSQREAHRFVLLGEMGSWLPLTSSLGLYHNERLSVYYEASTQQNDIYFKTDSSLSSSEITVPGESAGVGASLAAGGYFLAGQRWMFTAEIEVLGLDMSYSEGNNQGRTTSLIVSSHGALSPSINLASVGIGLRYLINRAPK
jgi:hypothetical protein